MGKGLESGATTPKSPMSELDMDERTMAEEKILYNLSEYSEIDMESIDTEPIEQDISAMVIRYRTIYIDMYRHPDPPKQWNTSRISVCCLESFWWIAIIDDKGTLHVIKLVGVFRKLK
eukprot:947145_1